MVALCDENEVKEMMWPHREEDLSNGLVPDAWANKKRMFTAKAGSASLHHPSEGQTLYGTASGDA